MTKPATKGSFIIRCYRMLIGLYPSDYRERFGDEQLQVFATECRAAGGRYAGVIMLLRWLPELLGSIRQERAEACAAPAFGRAHRSMYATLLLRLVPGMLIQLCVIGTVMIVKYVAVDNGSRTGIVVVIALATIAMFLSLVTAADVLFIFRLRRTLRRRRRASR